MPEQGRLLSGKEILARSMTEADFLREVRKRAHAEGWWTCHVRKGMAAAGRFITATDPPGLPDLILCRGPELIFAELKRVGQYPKPHQREVLAVLAAAVEAVVWRPSDWDAIVVRLARPPRPSPRPDGKAAKPSETSDRKV